jgi:hypothetical protein
MVKVPHLALLCVSEPIKSAEWMMPVQNAGTTRLYDSGWYLRYTKWTSILTMTKSRHIVTKINDQVLSSVVQQTALYTVTSNVPHYQHLKTYIWSTHGMITGREHQKCFKKIPHYCYFVHHKPWLLLQKDGDLTIWATSNFTSWVAELST